MTIRSLDWGTYTGCTVRIYRNLNNGMLSIQAKHGKTWKVVGHVTDCILENVIFRIGEAGRQRVIRERCKNVHAWGEGILVGKTADIFTPIALSYDPYSDQTFMQRGTNHAIHKCRYLAARDNLVFVSPDAIGSRPPADRSRRNRDILQVPTLFFAAA